MRQTRPFTAVPPLLQRACVWCSWDPICRITRLAFSRTTRSHVLFVFQSSSASGAGGGLAFDPFADAAKKKKKDKSKPQSGQAGVTRELPTFCFSCGETQACLTGSERLFRAASVTRRPADSAGEVHRSVADTTGRGTS